MGWPTPHTWVVGDAWPVTDANTYIRDAFVSVRRYQNSSCGTFADDMGSLTTTAETQAGVTHYNLLTSTPDEVFKMVIVTAVQLNTTLSGGQPANGAYVRIYDQNGSTLATNYSNVGANNDATIIALGGFGGYAAGANQGFKVTVQPFVNTSMAVAVKSIVFFAPFV